MCGECIAGGFISGIGNGQNIGGVLELGLPVLTETIHYDGCEGIALRNKEKHIPGIVLGNRCRRSNVGIPGTGHRIIGCIVRMACIRYADGQGSQSHTCGSPLTILGFCIQGIDLCKISISFSHGFPGTIHHSESNMGLILVGNTVGNIRILTFTVRILTIVHMNVIEVFLRTDGKRASGNIVQSKTGLRLCFISHLGGKGCFCCNKGVQIRCILIVIVNCVFVVLTLVEQLQDISSRTDRYGCGIGGMIGETFNGFHQSQNLGLTSVGQIV